MACCPSTPPTAYDPSTGTYIPLPPPPPMVIQLSDLIYPDANNALFIHKKKLMVRLVSQQAGNYARYGNDHGVYIDGNDVLSNAGDANLLTISPVDGKITLTKASLAAAGITGGSSGGSITPTPTTPTVSTQAGNLLVTGSDGGAYLSLIQLQAAGITPGGGSGGGSGATFPAVSGNAGNVLTLGTDGGPMLTSAAVWSAVQPSVASAIQSAVSGLTPGSGGTVVPGSLISSDANNGLTTGSDGKLFISLDAGEL